MIAYVLLSGLSPFLGDSDAETWENVTRAEPITFEDEEVIRGPFINDVTQIRPSQTLCHTFITYTLCLSFKRG